MGLVKFDQPHYLLHFSLFETKSQMRKDLYTL